MPVGRASLALFAAAKDWPSAPLLSAACFPLAAGFFGPFLGIAGAGWDGYRSPALPPRWTGREAPRDLVRKTRGKMQSVAGFGKDPHEA
jgi:hypothetical protein